MLQNYVPILIFLGVAAALGSVLMGLGFLFGPRRPDTEKLSAYECGFEPFEDLDVGGDVGAGGFEDGGHGGDHP